MEVPLASQDGDDANADPNDCEIQLVCKGTFIHACGKESEGESSPRAMSDPGSERSGSSHYHSYFAKERNYVARLSQQVSSTLTSKKGRSESVASTHSEDHDKIKHDSSDENLVIRSMSMPKNRPCGALAKAIKDEATAQNRLQAAKSVATAVGTTPVSGNTGSAQKQATTNDPELANLGEDMRLNRHALRVQMRIKAAEIKEVLQYQRLSTALTSINEIPEQVGEILQQSATNFVGEIEDEVQVAREMIVNSEDGNEQAAKSISKIPDMVMASFENSFAKALSNVRIRVDDVIQELEEQGGEMEKEEVVQQMWSIPEDVRQIAGNAIKEAFHASHVQVVEQLDYVMQNLPEESVPDALWIAKEQIVANIPQVLPETLSSAKEAAAANVRQATRVIEEKGHGVTGVVANRVVADTLMRAKVGNATQSSAAAPEALRLCNPGSIGHPELCSRACLYFPLGQCTNGMNCAFCHATHSKRAAHLDKRHREMLRGMDFNQRYNIILPILKTKLASEGLNISSEQMRWFNSLAELPMPEPAQAPKAERKALKEKRTLQIALKFMSARSLLALLHHSSLPKDSPPHQVIEMLLRQLRPQCYPGRRENTSRTGESRASDSLFEADETLSDGVGAWDISETL